MELKIICDDTTKVYYRLALFEGIRSALFQSINPIVLFKELLLCLPKKLRNPTSRLAGKPLKIRIEISRIQIYRKALSSFYRINVLQTLNFSRWRR